MSSRNVSVFMLQRLAAWAVRRIYGYPGDGTNGLNLAFHREGHDEGIRVEAPGEVGAAWDRALAAGRPAVIDVVTDPGVPPLPPHIRMEHAKGMTSALLHGDPDAGRIVRQTMREKLKDLVAR